jgi:hypothetical protein
MHFFSGKKCTIINENIITCLKRQILKYLYHNRLSINDKWGCQVFTFCYFDLGGWKIGLRTAKIKVLSRVRIEPKRYGFNPISVQIHCFLVARSSRQWYNSSFFVDIKFSETSWPLFRLIWSHIDQLTVPSQHKINLELIAIVRPTLSTMSDCKLWRKITSAPWCLVYCSRMLSWSPWSCIHAVSSYWWRCIVVSTVQEARFYPRINHLKSIHNNKKCLHIIELWGN